MKHPIYLHLQAPHPSEFGLFVMDTKPGVSEASILPMLWGRIPFNLWPVRAVAVLLTIIVELSHLS